MTQSLKQRLTDWSVVAHGNLSVCYRARDAALGRVVFIKALGPSVSTDPDLRARFLREARAVARLDHPNLVRLYEFGDDPELGLYMMLEWVEGRTLAARLADGPLNAGALQALAIELFAGLAALHEAGVVHRDLKPENILLKKDGSAKISDFSLAALRDEPRLTHHKAIVGTPAYMAPEQAAGKAPDERSDLFAAGVVLYEAATGKNPFAAEDVLETLRRVRQDEVVWDDRIVISLPLVLHELVRSCLEKSPGARPHSARAACDMLQPSGEPVRRRRPSIRLRDGLIAVGIIIVAVTAALAIRRGMSDFGSNTSLTTQPADTFPEVRDTVVAGEPASDSLAMERQGHVTEADLPVTESPAKPEPLPSDSARRMVAVESAAGTMLPESADVWLDVEPWAHVYHHGKRLGTTPLDEPLRLPVGRQTLSFQNAALPRIERAVEILPDMPRLHVRLTEDVFMLDVQVEPWGELFVDGERMGLTPLDRPLFFLPGSHTLRVTHAKLPAVERKFDAAAGETLRVKVNLDRSQLALERSPGVQP